jgi:TatD DNase family protein
MMSFHLIDSHAHLDLPEFTPDFDSTLKRAEAVGVKSIITIGIDLPSSKRAIELAIANRNIYATVGIHPTEASTKTDEALSELTRLANDPRVVAIGETGLDFYHMPFSEADQLRTLHFQLDLAANNGKPVVIHSREADLTMVPILIDWARSIPSQTKGVIHCFNGSIETAEKYLNAGFYISLGGYVTYPSSRKNYEVYRFIPADRLLLETDSPFLPPQTHRGQRNEPSYLLETARTLAAVKGMPLEELAEITSKNTRDLFKLA